MQPLSLKTILVHLPRSTFFGVLLATSLVYLAIDLVPILQIFPNVESKIVLVLWQSLLWMVYSVFISFYLNFELGRGFDLVEDKNFLFFILKYFPEFLSLKLRTLVKTTLWAFLFIIPGFVMMLRYSLGELVVFFSPNFLDDRTQDPLTISSDIVGFHLLRLTLLASLYYVLPTVFDSTFDHAHFMYEPRSRVIQIILYSTLNLVTYIYLFKIFFRTQQSSI